MTPCRRIGAACRRQLSECRSESEMAGGGRRWVGRTPRALHRGAFHSHYPHETLLVRPHRGRRLGDRLPSLASRALVLAGYDDVPLSRGHSIARPPLTADALGARDAAGVAREFGRFHDQYDRADCGVNCIWPRLLSLPSFFFGRERSRVRRKEPFPCLATQQLSDAALRHCFARDDDALGNLVVRQTLRHVGDDLRL